jgi:hypothetical protein
MKTCLILPYMRELDFIFLSEKQVFVIFLLKCVLFFKKKKWGGGGVDVATNSLYISSNILCI